MNKIQIRFADSGSSIQIQVPTHQTISYIMEILRRQHRMEPQDQKFLTKTGIVVRPDDKLSAIQAELQKTISAEGGNSKLSLLNCFYVYNERFLKSGEVMKSFSEQEQLRQFEDRLIKYSNLKQKLEFQPIDQIYSKEQISFLRAKNQNITEYSGFMLQHYSKINDLLFKYTQFKHYLSEINTNSQSQNKASQILLKNLLINLDQVVKRKSLLSSKIEALGKNIEQTKKNLQDLKMKPMNDKIQLDKDMKGKSIYDIYFTDTKNLEILKRLSSVFHTVRKTSEHLDNDLDSLQNKIGAKRKNSSAKIKEYSKKISEHQDSCNDKDLEQIYEIKNSIREEISVMMDHIEKYLNHEDNPQTVGYLINLGKKVQKYTPKFEDQMNFINNRIESTIRVLLEAKKCHQMYSVFIKQFFRSYDKYMIRLNQIQGEIVKIEKQQTTCMREIDNSLNIKQAEDAYNCSLKEVVRRANFINKLESLYIQMQSLRDDESEKRRKYYANRKKLKFPEFISNLQGIDTPEINILYKNDSKLPKIDPLEQTENVLHISERKQVGRLKQNTRYQCNCDNNRILQDLQNITANINNYRKNRENPEYTKWETKLNNLEEILLKSSKIIYNVYSKKLAEQTKKQKQSLIIVQNQLKKYKLELETQKEEIDSLLQENKEFKHKYDKKVQDYLRIEKQFKKISENNKNLKEQLNQKIDQNAKMSLELNNLQRNIRSLNQQIMVITKDNKIMQQERKATEEEVMQYKKRFQSAEISMKKYQKQQQILQQEKDKYEYQMKDLKKIGTPNEVIEKIKFLDQSNKKLEKSKKETNETIKQLENQIQLLNKEISTLQSEKKVQEDSIQQLKYMLANKYVEALSKDQTLADTTADVNSKPQIQWLKMQNERLQQQLMNAEKQLHLIIMKQTQEIQTQTEIYIQHHQQHHLQQDVVQINKISETKLMIFVPYSMGIYMPLVMDNDKAEPEESNKNITSYKNNFYLDLKCLDVKIRQLITECSLILVAKVKMITQKTANIDENPYSLCINEKYQLIEIEKPKHIIGFEEQDNSIKDYACV